MANGQASAGDMTGRLKAQAAREQKEQNAERDAETAMNDQFQSEEELNGVFDAQSGVMIDEGRPTYVVDEVEEEESPQQQFGGFRNRSEEPIFTGKESPEALAPAIASRKTFSSPSADIARSPMVRVRVESDIDKMTYGMRNGEPNNFDFKEGLTYEIPREVAEHLDGRGVIKQWVRN
jgi:hypothetical protein